MMLRLLLELSAAQLLAVLGHSLTACGKLLDGVQSQITLLVQLFFVEGCG